MRQGFQPKKIIAALICCLAVFSAVVSGSIYGVAWDIFSFGSVALVFLAVSGGRHDRSLPPWPVFLLPAVATASLFWTININNSVHSAFFLAALAFFSYSAATLDSQGRELAFKSLLAAAVIVSVYGIYQYFIGFAHTEEYLAQVGMEESLEMSIVRYRRVFSTFMSPNIFACWLAMVFPCGLRYLLTETRSSRKAAYGVVLGLILLTLVLTKSIGGFIGFGAGIFTFFVVYISKTRHSIKQVAIPALLVVVIALAGGAAVMKQRAGGMFGTGKSIDHRMEYWSVAGEIIGETGVLGNGAGTFEIVYPGHKKPGMDEIRHAHNIFIETIIDTGYPGLAAVLIFFAGFFYYCLRKLPCADTPDDYTLTAVLAAGGAAFFAHNLMDFSFYQPETAVPFWLFFGIAASRMREGRAVCATPDEPGGNGANTASAVVAVVALVFAVFYAKSYIAGIRQSEALALLGEQGIKTSAAARTTPAPPEAVRLAESAVSLTPYDDRMHLFLAGLYEGRAYADGPSSAKKAEAEYLEAIRLNPIYPYHYRDLGILYMKLGDRKRAAERFKDGLRMYPASVELKKCLESVDGKPST